MDKIIKKKLAYLSIDSFVDSDLPILPELNKYYKVTYILMDWGNLKKDYSNRYLEDFFNEHNIEYSIYHVMHRHRSVETLFFYFTLINKIKEEGFDLFYIGTLGYPWLPLVIRFSLNTRIVVFGIHDYIMHFGETKRYIKSIFAKLTYSLFDNFIFFSKSQASMFHNRYSKKNILATKLCLKNYGLFSEPPQKKRRILFLYFGNIRDNKGLDLLIKAFENLIEVNFEIRNLFHLTIAGFCENFEQVYLPLIKHYENYTLKIERINSSEIPSIFAGANYLVLPYRDVTQSGPLMIAYNYNVPVIAPDFEGFKEHIEHNKNGFLYDHLDKDGLSKLLNQLIKIDPAEHERIKKNLNTSVLQAYNTTNIIHEYVDYFNSIKR